MQINENIIVEAKRHGIKDDVLKELIREYKSYSQVLGKFVKIRSLNKTLEGQVIDFDPEGALILRDNFGFKIKLFSSEVIFLR